LCITDRSPFAYMQNVPFRIYSGDLAGAEIYSCITKQIFWFAALLFLGIVIWKQAEKRVVVQGG
ncbi:MAG: ABC transporter permease, partial [Lachnospiraceae bacterium]|nr:ABC transporter permease [Lachnospiraceae bacterium]